MKAAQIGPSSLPHHDIPVGHLSPGLQKPWSQSRLRRKNQRILFAPWTNIPSQSLTLFASTLGAITNLPQSVARQIEADWERIRGLPTAAAKDASSRSSATAMNLRPRTSFSLPPSP
jgi:hypothetical protein